MSSTVETYTVATDGLTLSRIVWNRFKRSMPGLVERILDATPSLARSGPYLPVGTVVQIPIDTPREQQEVAVVSLWD
jgi:phage tail protein X